MEWNPGPKYRAYLSAIQEVLQNGEKRTVRDVYYALEARGFPDELRKKSYSYAFGRWETDPEENPHPDNVPASEWEWTFDYDYVKRAVKKGRRAGYIDPEQIYDASRRAETTVDTGYDSPESFLSNQVEGIWNHYRENFWREQETYVEVWLEKQSLASVFAPICNEWNVRLEATRGDWSDSKVYEATQRLRGKMEAGKDVRILYFGDYNPSGFHAPVSIVQTMKHYGLSFDSWELQSDSLDSTDAAYYDVEAGSPVRARWYESEEEMENDGAGTLSSLAFERLAVNPEDIAEFDLPENPTPSSSDKDRKIRESFMEHVSGGRDVNVELNALKEFQRDYLEDLIEDGISNHVDEDLKGEVARRVEEAKRDLSEAVQIDRDAL
jgi:hypothetical protein